MRSFEQSKPAILHRRAFRLARLAIAWCGAIVLIESGAVGQLEFELPPINYGTAPVNDRIARLQDQLDRGETNLEQDRKSTRLNSSHTDISRMPSSA